jgi:hypothetical protein
MNKSTIFLVLSLIYRWVDREDWNVDLLSVGLATGSWTRDTVCAGVSLRNGKWNRNARNNSVDNIRKAIEVLVYSEREIDFKYFL